MPAGRCEERTCRDKGAWHGANEPIARARKSIQHRAALGAAPEAARRGQVTPSGLEHIPERHMLSGPHAVGHEGATGEQPESLVRRVGALPWIVTSRTSQRSCACRLSTSRVGRRAVRCAHKATASCIGLCW